MLAYNTTRTKRKPNKKCSGASCGGREVPKLDPFKNHNGNKQEAIQIPANREQEPDNKSETNCGCKCCRSVVALFFKGSVVRVVVVLQRNKDCCWCCCLCLCRCYCV